MTTITVFYETQRKVFKSLSPSTLLQQVLAETAEEFRLPPANCSLKFRKSVLDPSQPLRYSGLPNNAQIDLIVSSTSTRQSCKVAITFVENSSSMNGVFSDTSSLSDILQKFVLDGVIPSNIFDKSPEFIYLRASFRGDALRTTTLSSLGLSGQTVRFHLKTNALINRPVDSPVSAVQRTSPKYEAVEQNLPPSHTSPKSEAVEQNLPPSHAINHESISTLIPPLSYGECPMEVVPEKEHVPSFSPAEAVQLLLEGNFDAVTKPAVLTLVKYLLNMRLNPGDEKFRRIKAENKVFQEKVRPAKGAVEFLLSVGFREGEGRVYQLESDNKLQEGLDVLARAMVELDIPEDERPDVKATPPPAPATATEFDPFRPVVIRQAVQPFREESITAIQLEQLKRKRAELEGEPSAVSRDTKVVFPAHNQGSVSDLSHLSEGKFDRESEEAESSAVPKALLQKILRKEDETPLTTLAVRELQKLQTEKVYQKTVVRIRFPDKVQLVGSFHPRHSLADVYEWILDCLVNREAVTPLSSRESRVVRAMNLFELFISPPKTILLPATLDKSRRAVKSWNEADLSYLNLVPAAVLNLSWRHPESFESGELGSYLKETILGRFESNNVASKDLIPLSIPLVPSSAKVEASRADLPDEKSSGDKNSGKSASKPMKPKWFKL